MVGQYRIYLCKNKQGRIIEQGKAFLRRVKQMKAFGCFQKWQKVLKMSHMICYSNVRIETVEDTIYIDIFLLTQVLSTFLSGSSRE